MPTVLVADDDRRIVDMLRRTLIYEGFQVVSAANGQETLAAMQQVRPDLVVLDWLMPHLDGIDVIRRIRQGVAGTNNPPVLMLTARDAVEDRVQGLDSGADDYLVKPFAPAELIARIHALLRRSSHAPEQQVLRYADLSLDPVTRETQRGDRAFELSPKEFDLLTLLLRHPRQVLSRERILRDVWDWDLGVFAYPLEKVN
jgi:two-component system, OmpR family, response regulator MprA